MGLFTFEHSKVAHHVDFALYGIAVLLLTVFLLVADTGEQWPEIWALALGGFASWSGIEYALHRIVLHGLQPFRRWHALHHASIEHSGHYGVTSSVWDHVFGSTRRAIMTVVVEKG